MFCCKILDCFCLIFCFEILGNFGLLFCCEILDCGLYSIVVKWVNGCILWMVYCWSVLGCCLYGGIMEVVNGKVFFNDVFEDELLICCYFCLFWIILLKKVW